MPKETLSALSAVGIIALCALALIGRAQAQGAAPPDVGGTYKCQPSPSPCRWSGPSATISQTGNKMQIKGENGALADGTVTSDITISAGGTFNSLGIIRPDKSIDWSDGTKWSK
jgi:hypothetical protein